MGKMGIRYSTFTPRDLMESSRAVTPAKLPVWLKARMLTWYMTASSREGTPAKGVPYCGGGGVVGGEGGVTGLGSSFPQPASRTAAQASDKKRLVRAAIDFMGEELVRAQHH